MHSRPKGFLYDPQIRDLRSFASNYRNGKLERGNHKLREPNFVSLMLNSATHHLPFSQTNPALNTMEVRSFAELRFNPNVLVLFSYL